MNGISQRKKSHVRNSEKNKNDSILSKKENLSNLINENIEYIFRSVKIFFTSIYEIFLSIIMFFYYILFSIKLIFIYFLYILFNY